MGRIICGEDADGGLGGGTDGGGGGDRRDGDGLSWWENNVKHAALGTETNAPIAYALGLKHHQPIISTLGYPGSRLERERRRIHFLECTYFFYMSSW